ncbi:MAG: flagellar FliJ family protein [Opitutaceae bacterium]|nr:flagellar FliJ family protein [Opitutaceae bacterium]
MKRFRFPLRPVAVLRSHRETQARDAFAAAVRECTVAELEVQQVRERVGQFEAALHAGRRECFSGAAEAAALAAYRRECEAEAEAERACARARAFVQQRRAEYAEAHRRVKVIDNLEHKARAQHRADAAREEQLGFDELALRRFTARVETLSP